MTDYWLEETSELRPYPYFVFRRRFTSGCRFSTPMSHAACEDRVRRMVEKMASPSNRSQIFYSSAASPIP